MSELVSARVSNLGASLRFARESKMGSKTSKEFATQSGFAYPTLRLVESGHSKPSQGLIEEYRKLDSLPCKRTICEGNTSCDACTVETIVAGLEFNRSKNKASIEEKTLSNDAEIAGIIIKLGLTPEQIAEARRRIFQSSLEICLDIAKRSDTNPK